MGSAVEFGVFTFVSGAGALTVSRYQPYGQWRLGGEAGAPEGKGEGVHVRAKLWWGPKTPCDYPGGWRGSFRGFPDFQVWVAVWGGFRGIWDLRGFLGCYLGHLWAMWEGCKGMRGGFGVLFWIVYFGSAKPILVAIWVLRLGILCSG